MRSIFAPLFPAPQIDVEAELRSLIDQKKSFIEDKQRANTALRDDAQWIKNQISWNATEIHDAEREIAALEKALGELAPSTLPALVAENDHVADHFDRMSEEELLGEIDRLVQDAIAKPARKSKVAA